MATKKITSTPSKTKVGTTGTEVNTFTETTYEVDNSGKIIENSAVSNLYYSPAPGNYLLAATSKDGGKTWTYTTDPNSSNGLLLGDDTKNSLETGALKTTTQQQITDSATKAGISTEEQKKLATSTTNAATTPEGSDQNPTLTSEQERDIGTEAKGTRNTFGTNLYYPITLKKDKQDILQIDMVKYSPTPLSSETLSGFGTKPTKEEIKGTVYLPIPAGISDSNGVSWQSDEINPLQAAGANFATSAITGGAAAAGQTLENQAGAVQGGIGSIKTALAAAVAESAIGTQNLLSRTKGVVTNPNMELIFTGPQLRQFSFTYKLSSRSKKESEMIRSIIRFFKQGMAVQRTEAQLFLKAPFTFKLTYKHQNKDHIYLNKFKECALTNFSVDYTPEGQYATFTDGAMVSYQITMQFQELNPIFNDDYGNKENTFPDPDIGY